MILTYIRFIDEVEQKKTAKSYLFLMFVKYSLVFYIQKFNVHTA